MTGPARLQRGLEEGRGSLGSCTQEGLLEVPSVFPAPPMRTDKPQGLSQMLPQGNGGLVSCQMHQMCIQNKRKQQNVVWAPTAAAAEQEEGGERLKACDPLHPPCGF